MSDKKLEPVQMFCPNCGKLVIGYKAKMERFASVVTDARSFCLVSNVVKERLTSK